MKRRIHYIVPAFLLFFVLAVSCKKSSPDKPAEKTKTELITQSSWKFDNVKVGGTDVSSLLEACDKDNTVTFSSNGSGIVDEGTTQCNSSDPATVDFTWNFENNETTLYASAPLFPGGNGNFTIISLSSTQLVLSQDIDISGSTQNAIITLKH
jgi:hypothetical protein